MFDCNMSHFESKLLVKQEEGRIERWAWSVRRRERSYVVLGEATQLTDTGPPCSPPAVPGIGILGHSPLCSGSEPVSVCFIIFRHLSITGRQTLPAQLPSNGQWRIVMNVPFLIMWLSLLDFLHATLSWVWIACWWGCKLSSPSPKSTPPRPNPKTKAVQFIWCISEDFCQAQVQIQIQSRSIPGPIQIYFKSFQSILIQNQMIWTRSWCYFHCVTTQHHPPRKL